MKKEKETEPVLIDVNTIELGKHLHIIRTKLLPLLEKVKTEFLKLGLGPLTDEYLEDILHNGMKLICEELGNQVKKETPSRFLQNDARKQANSLLSKLNSTLEKVDIFAIDHAVLLDFVSVDDAGNIVLADEGIERLRDMHSTYCITEGGLELLDAHKKAAEALNRFYQMGKANLSEDTRNLEELFYFDPEGNLIPAFQDYDRFQYARKKRD